MINTYVESLVDTPQFIKMVINEKYFKHHMIDRKYKYVLCNKCSRHFVIQFHHNIFNNMQRSIIIPSIM